MDAFPMLVKCFTHQAYDIPLHACERCGEDTPLNRAFCAACAIKSQSQVEACAWTPAS